MKILFDNGHGIDTPGKRSPDGVLREYARNRLIAGRVVSALTDLGHDAALLVPEQEDIPLSERCRRVNELCRLLGRDNVILISIHTNAAGRGDRWYDATGWCAYTTRGDTLADALATSLYEAAKFHLPGQRLRTDYTDGDPDLEANFYLLRRTLPPAVLVENFFMDSRRDYEFLLSPEGQQAIVRQLPTVTDSTKVEIRIVEKIVRDTAWMELPVIIEKKTTLDTSSVLENKYAKSEASMSAGVLHHSLETKPVREPVPVEYKEIIRDSIVYRDRIVREDVYIEKELTFWQCLKMKMGGFAILLIAIAILYLLFNKLNLFKL